MEQENVFISFFLDGSRPNSENKCLIKLNIYQKPDKKRYATKYHATKEEWEKINSPKLRDPELKDIKQGLKSVEVKAQKIISTLNPFSFVSFEGTFFNKSSITHNNTLKYWFDNYIKQLKQAGQIGTAMSYQTTINSINSFKSNLSVHDVTPGFLQDYENHLLGKGRSISTVGIYMRQLRAIINQESMRI